MPRSRKLRGQLQLECRAYSTWVLYAMTGLAVCTGLAAPSVNTKLGSEAAGGGAFDTTTGGALDVDAAGLAGSGFFSATCSGLGSSGFLASSAFLTSSTGFSSLTFSTGFSFLGTMTTAISLNFSPSIPSRAARNTAAQITIP